MYHISNDKRAKKSALLICYGLAECLKTKPFSEITVSDIYRASSIGRSTFYRLFDNTADVLSYQCNLLFQETIHAFSNDGSFHSAKEYILTFMKLCLKYPQLVKAVANSNRIDLLYEAHLIYCDMIKNALFPDKDISDIQMNYILRLLTSAIISMLVIWADEDQTTTPEILYKNCRASIQLLNDLLK